MRKVIENPYFFCLFAGNMYVILTLFIVHWYASIFMQTFFLHRYAAHKMFTMSPFMERVCFVLNYLINGSSYLDAYTYGALHRMHHAYADTEKDPHSPLFDDNLFSMMWRTKKIYCAIEDDEFPVEEKFLKGLPRWKAFDNIASATWSRIAWGVVYLIIYIIFAPSPWFFLLLPIHFLMGPIHGVIINWFSHKYGYRNFECSDTSTNYLPFDFLTLGEGYHNNHHKYGSRANFGGVRWHEWDITYSIMKLMDKVGVIKLLKPTPTPTT